MDRADGIIFMFSFIDKSSFNDLPHQMTRISADKVCRFVIGTKYPFLDYVLQFSVYFS